ncbi:CASP-like protein 4B2 [Curcuma longa]|uniref:CASP-like protein 4B2 n=1 Tax=Curcuma longa TaxID=136217 RepID=UPI003D9F91C0
MDSTVALSSDESAEVPRSIVPVVAPPPPPPVVEKGPPITPAAGGADEGSKVVRSVVRRWKREDLLEKAGLVLRALAWVFSLVAVALLASNKQGGWMNFDRYQEFRYLLSVAAIAMVYSMVQLLRQAHRFATGKDFAPLTYSWTFDFAGDQVVAYLLISASSAAIPITDRMRREVVNTFTDISVVAISLTLLSFVALGSCALISGFKIARRSYF